MNTKYYRYYNGESGGGDGQLKYVFEADSYARLEAALGTSVDQLSDTQVDDFADRYYEYGGDDVPAEFPYAVSKVVMQGAGCSSCSGVGQGTFTYKYEVSTVGGWHIKTTETLPDHSDADGIVSENTYWTDDYGRIMLQMATRKAGGSAPEQKWLTYYAHPSAVSDYNEGWPSLVSDPTLPDDDYFHLRQNAGLVERFAYYTSTDTNLSLTVAGGVKGFFKEHTLHRGREASGGLKQRSAKYFKHTTVVSGITVYPVGRTYSFRAGTENPGVETNYGYTFLDNNSLRIIQRSIHYPSIAISQNGPITTDSEITNYDDRGRPLSFVDANGKITNYEYDDLTGAMTKMIVDQASLNLVTTYVVDILGRTTKRTDPRGNITYFVYNDSNHEVRTYRGWLQNNMTIGPIEVTRARKHAAYPLPTDTLSYVETFTMSVTPNVTGNEPNGTEPIANLQSLTRTFINKGGQVPFVDYYVSMNTSSFTNDTDGIIDGATRYRWEYGYDKRGRRDRVLRPTGTIERTLYDGLGRVVSTSVGTDDDGVDANMTRVRHFIYDSYAAYDPMMTSGDMADSRLTQVAELPGGGAANRVTHHFYDWRNRRVATKGGATSNPTTESDSVQRPFTYVEFDNWNQPTIEESYDGDQVAVLDADSNGIPDRPAVGKLRAKTVTSYDDQRRVFRTEVFSVNQDSGVVSANALKSDTWYSRRGETIKTTAPASPVTKHLYDNAGRLRTTYITDGRVDSTWDHAASVSDDNVLLQTDIRYDFNDNDILLTTKQRYDVITLASECSMSRFGPLSFPGGACPKARTTYVGRWYDRADRLTDEVDYGTYGGNVLNQPPADPPAGSDIELRTNYSYKNDNNQDTGRLQKVTDPRGIVTKTEYDMLGRTLKTVEAYVDGDPSGGDDRTTEYTYDGSGHVLTLTAKMTGSDLQKTEYVYCTTTPCPGTSDVQSKELLLTVKYPHKTDGTPSDNSNDQEKYLYNALGEVKRFTDRRDTAHEYEFDVMDRMLHDKVTALGGADGTVKRLETAYDTAGRPFLFGSYADLTGTTPLNEVKREFNGFGQLIAESQSHTGAATGSTPKVQYAYSEMDYSGSYANHSRPKNMTYPDGRVVNYNYLVGLNNDISRLTSISNGGFMTTYEQYTHLGLNTVVKRTHPNAFVQVGLDYVGEDNGEAGDPYIGLDRFGRVIDQRWIKSNDVDNPLDQFKYGYDRNSNRLYKDNWVTSGPGAAYDDLYHGGGASGPHVDV